MRRMGIAAASVIVAVGLWGVVGASASPPIGDPFNPTFPPAQHLCIVQGGDFGFTGPGDFYFCTRTTEFSQGELNGARGLCEGGYRGLFAVDVFGDSPNYICLPFAGNQAG